jgi:hypothetical protein
MFTLLLVGRDCKRKYKEELREGQWDLQVFSGIPQ